MMSRIIAFVMLWGTSMAMTGPVLFTAHNYFYSGPPPLEIINYHSRLASIDPTTGKMTDHDLTFQESAIGQVVGVCPWEDKDRSEKEIFTPTVFWTTNGRVSDVRFMHRWHIKDSLSKEPFGMMSQDTQGMIFAQGEGDPEMWSVYGFSSDSSVIPGHANVYALELPLTGNLDHLAGSIMPQPGYSPGTFPLGLADDTVTRTLFVLVGQSSSKQGDYTDLATLYRMSMNVDHDMGVLMPMEEFKFTNISMLSNVGLIFNQKTNKLLYVLEKAMYVLNPTTGATEGVFFTFNENPDLTCMTGDYVTGSDELYVGCDPIHVLDLVTGKLKRTLKIPLENYNSLKGLRFYKHTG